MRRASLLAGNGTSMGLLIFLISLAAMYDGWPSFFCSGFLVDDFYQLVTSVNPMVDKSLLIKAYLASTDPVTVINQPRKFGKSINLDMLKRFLEIEVDERTGLGKNVSANRVLFEGGSFRSNAATAGSEITLAPLNIGREKRVMEVQGQCPVLLVRLTNATGGDYDEIVSETKRLVSDLYRERPYLESGLRDSELELFRRYCSANFSNDLLENSLRFLARSLGKHFGRNVHLLVDDYDVPLTSLAGKLFRRMKLELRTIRETKLLEQIFRSEPFDRTRTLFRRLFGSTMGDNALAKAFFVGTYPIDVLDRKLYSDDASWSFSKFYGFTVRELNELFGRLPFEVDRVNIIHWFGEYRFKQEGMINPLSIMRCLANSGKLGNYWWTGGVETPLTDGVFMADQLQPTVRLLAEGGRIGWNRTANFTFPARRQDDGGEVALLAVLHFAGYLRYCNATASLKVYSPEVQNAFKVKILKWARLKFNADGEDFSILAEYLSEFKMDRFEDKFQNHLDRSPDWLVNEKWFYEAIVDHIRYSLSGIYEEKRVTDRGYRIPSTVLIAKSNSGTNNAIIFKYKLAETDESRPNRRAKEGLMKLDKLILRSIRQHRHIKKVMKLCMVFLKKSFSIDYDIFDVP